MEMVDLLQCIDKGLDRLGSNAKQKIYCSLLIKRGTPLSRLITNPQLFSQLLDEMLGPETLEVIEISIVKEIKKVFGLKYPSSSYNLAEAMDIALGRVSGPTASMVMTSQPLAY